MKLSLEELSQQETKDTSYNFPSYRSTKLQNTHLQSLLQKTPLLHTSSSHKNLQILKSHTNTRPSRNKQNRKTLSHTGEPIESIEPAERMEADEAADLLHPHSHLNSRQLQHNPSTATGIAINTRSNTWLQLSILVSEKKKRKRITNLLTQQTNINENLRDENEALQNHQSALLSLLQEKDAQIKIFRNTIKHQAVSYVNSPNMNSNFNMRSPHSNTPGPLVGKFMKEKHGRVQDAVNQNDISDFEEHVSERQDQNAKIRNNVGEGYAILEGIKQRRLYFAFVRIKCNKLEQEKAELEKQVKRTNEQISNIKNLSAYKLVSITLDYFHNIFFRIEYARKQQAFHRIQTMSKAIKHFDEVKDNNIFIRNKQAQQLLSLTLKSAYKKTLSLSLNRINLFGLKNQELIVNENRKVNMKKYNRFVSAKLLGGIIQKKLKNITSSAFRMIFFQHVLAISEEVNSREREMYEFQNEKERSDLYLKQKHKTKAIRSFAKRRRINYLKNYFQSWRKWDRDFELQNKEEEMLQISYLSKQFVSINGLFNIKNYILKMDLQTLFHRWMNFAKISKRSKGMMNSDKDAVELYTNKRSRIPAGVVSLTEILNHKNSQSLMKQKGFNTLKLLLFEKIISTQAIQKWKSSISILFSIISYRKTQQNSKSFQQIKAFSAFKTLSLKKMLDFNHKHTIFHLQKHFSLLKAYSHTSQTLETVSHTEQDKNTKNTKVLKAKMRSLEELMKKSELNSEDWKIKFNNLNSQYETLKNEYFKLVLEVDEEKANVQELMQQNSKLNEINQYQNQELNAFKEMSLQRNLVGREQSNHQQSFNQPSEGTEGEGENEYHIFDELQKVGMSPILQKQRANHHDDKDTNLSFGLQTSPNLLYLEKENPASASIVYDFEKLEMEKEVLQIEKQNLQDEREELLRKLRTLETNVEDINSENNIHSKEAGRIKYEYERLLGEFSKMKSDNVELKSNISAKDDHILELVKKSAHADQALQAKESKILDYQGELTKLLSDSRALEGHEVSFSQNILKFEAKIEQLQKGMQIKNKELLELQEKHTQVLEAERNLRGNQGKLEVSLKASEESQQKFLAELNFLKRKEVNFAHSKTNSEDKLIGMTKTIDNLAFDKQILVQELESAANDIKILRKNYDKQLEFNQAMKTQLSESNSKVQEKEQELHSFAKGLTKKSSQIDLELKNKDKIIDKITGTNEELQNTIQEYERENSQLIESNQLLNQSVSRLKSTNTSSRTTGKKKLHTQAPSSAHNRKQGVNTSGSSAMSLLASPRGSNNASSLQQQNQIETKIKQLRDANNKLQKSIIEKNNRIDKLKNENSDMAKEVVNSSKELNHAKVQLKQQDERNKKILIENAKIKENMSINEQELLLYKNKNQELVNKLNFDQRKGIELSKVYLLL